MPLQQIPAENAETSARVANPFTAETPRYEAEAVRRILVLAGELQTRHRETLSPAEIEALGRDAGVEPEFVRRALAEWEIRPAGATPTGRRVKSKKHKRGLEPSPWRRRAVVLAPLLAYLVAAPILMTCFYNANRDAIAQSHIHHRQSQPVLLYSIIFWCIELIIPTFLAFGVGCLQKSRREAAGLGALYGLAPLLAFAATALLAMVLPTRQPNYSGMDAWTIFAYGLVVLFLVAGTWMGVGALFALGGAAVRRKLSARRNAFLPARVVIK